MYLEPIFSSEDIMRQMPEEARNFRKVDKAWRDIMKGTLQVIYILNGWKHIYFQIVRMRIPIAILNI